MTSDVQQIKPDVVAVQVLRVGVMLVLAPVVARLVGRRRGSGDQFRAASRPEQGEWFV